MKLKGKVISKPSNIYTSGGVGVIKKVGANKPLWPQPILKPRPVVHHTLLPVGGPKFKGAFTTHPVTKPSPAKQIMALEDKLDKAIRLIESVKARVKSPMIRQDLDRVTTELVRIKLNISTYETMPHPEGFFMV